IFIPAIRYPTVARGQARLRLTISAAHSSADIAALLAALKHCCEKPG
ncbi:MAG TPA: 8-amino-7-oxononanoate synthase, partial [Verrucomicrobiae bacterium]|nr:8-amino-7-oxononanoate synthase [Verrucomicrobiae bacterium]